MRFLNELDVQHECVLVGDAVLEGLVVDVQDVLTSAAPPPATSAADLGRKRMRMRMMINMGMRMRIRVRRMPPPRRSRLHSMISRSRCMWSPKTSFQPTCCRSQPRLRRRSRLACSRTTAPWYLEAPHQLDRLATHMLPAMKKATMLSLESSWTILVSARCFSFGTMYLSHRQRNF